MDRASVAGRRWDGRGIGRGHGPRPSIGERERRLSGMSGFSGRVDERGV